MPAEKYVDVKRAQLPDKQDSHHIHFRYVREMQRVIYMGLHVYFTGDMFEMSLRLMDELARLKAGTAAFERQQKGGHPAHSRSAHELLAPTVKAVDAHEEETDPEDGTEMLDGERRALRGVGKRGTALVGEAMQEHGQEDRDLERVEGQAAIHSVARKDSMMSHSGKTGSDHAGSTHGAHSPSFAKLHDTIKALRPVMAFCAFFQSAVVNVEWTMQQRVMAVLHHMAPKVEADPQATPAEKKAVQAELRYHTAEVIKSNGFAMFEHAMAEQWNVVDVSLFQSDLPEEKVLVPVSSYNPFNWFVRPPTGVYGGYFSNWREIGSFKKWKASLHLEKLTLGMGAKWHPK